MELEDLVEPDFAVELGAEEDPDFAVEPGSEEESGFEELGIVGLVFPECIREALDHLRVRVLDAPVPYPELLEILQLAEGVPESVAKRGQGEVDFLRSDQEY